MQRPFRRARKSSRNRSLLRAYEDPARRRRETRAVVASHWTEFTARRPFLTPQAPRGAMELATSLEKIANTGHIGRRRRPHPANAGLWAKIVTKSHYDELHDKYDAILTTKSGTRYERLAAMVFKALDESNAVIHDLKLVGESDVAHQIDVHLTVGGRNRRVIVECKDFDVSGDKVGLDIVRNFWAVLDDTKADEGIMVTCNSFTEVAQKFAKAKGIKLLVLRLFGEMDWEGRIRTFVLRLIAVSPANARMTIFVPDEAEKARFAAASAGLWKPGGIAIYDPVFLVKDRERVQFNEFMSRHVLKAIPLKNTPDKATVRVPSDGWKLQIQQEQPISFDRVEISFDIQQNEMESVLTSSRVAELLLAGFGEADLIIYGDQLERRKINPQTGEVM